MAKKNLENHEAFKNVLADKRAMVNVLAEISDSIFANIEWYNKHIEETEETLKEMRENWDTEQGGVIENDWSYKTNMEDIKLNRQRILAYYKVLETLENLI